MKGWRPQWASALPRSAVVLHDLAMVWLSWNGLTLVRYALAGTPVPLPPLWSAETVVVLLAQGLVLWRVGLYRGLWRFASVPDLLNLCTRPTIEISTSRAVAWSHKMHKADNRDINFASRSVVA